MKRYTVFGLAMLVAFGVSADSNKRKVCRDITTPDGTQMRCLGPSSIPENYLHLMTGNHASLATFSPGALPSVKTLDGPGACKVEVSAKNGDLIISSTIGNATMSLAESDVRETIYSAMALPPTTTAKSELVYESRLNKGHVGNYQLMTTNKGTIWVAYIDKFEGKRSNATGTKLTCGQ